MSKMASCIFCKIVKNEIPAFKLFESDKTLAFLDINPLSRGHSVRRPPAPTRPTEPNTNKRPVQLIIPKHHGVKLTDVPDDALTEILAVAKRIARATGAVDWNLLQNNGRRAHQMVDHVHFHVIPKPPAAAAGAEEGGLGVGWPMTDPGTEALKGLFEEMKSKM
jgi:diadenosine tetraphosphate (Ap4A) HIT family hydrolase